MRLTYPLTADELLEAFPLATRGMAPDTVDALLEVEERALRALYSVSGTEAEHDDALRAAMLAAWPSFMQQVRQVASEQHSTDGHSISYARAGVIDFKFPDFVGAILGSVADEGAAIPSTTELVR